MKLFTAFILALASTLTAPPPALGADNLPAAANFAADARTAAQSRRPVLVLFSQTGCPWCERVRREFLLPMQRNAGYQSRILFRQVDMDLDTPMTGFDGRATTHKALAASLKVKLYPTVMLFGPDGDVLAEPLIGFGIADFYGAYLDERIDTAAAALARRR